MPQRYPSIGRCIYCGNEEGKRGEEHIVPRALAGDAIIFDDASCRDCEKMINKFEHSVLSKVLGPSRRRVGAPSRPRKGRKTTTHFPMHIVRMRPGLAPIIVHTLNVPANEYPVMFIGLRLTPPLMLKGLRAQGNEKVDGHGCIDTEAMKRFGIEAGLSIQMAQINPYPFAQLLAKIAYAYTVAEIGYDAFNSLIHPLLKGDADHFIDLVGGDYDIPEKADELFSLQRFVFDAGVARFQCVKIRLWGWLGTPVYHVVVGTL